MPTLYQYGHAGPPPQHCEFFQTPPVSLDEMRRWMNEGAGENAIGLGGVVDARGSNIGELVMLGTKLAYMVGRDGKAKPLPAGSKVVFAQIGYMQPQQRISLDVDSMDDLQRKLDAQLPAEMKGAYMVRIHGVFADMAFRAADADGKLLENWTQLLSRDNSFTFAHPGEHAYELVGVYSKRGAVEENVTFDEVFHLHGLDAEHREGGHVTGFGRAHVTVDVMPIQHWLSATRDAAQASPSAPMAWIDRIRVKVSSVVGMVG